MPVVVTARHMHAIGDVQDYARSKGEALVQDFAKVEHVHVILDREKHRNTAAVVIQAKNHIRVEAEHSSANLRASIDAAFGRAERQLRKFREKVRERRTQSRRINKHARPSADDETGAVL